jgi:hypothetical protein
MPPRPEGLAPASQPTALKFEQEREVRETLAILKAQIARLEAKLPGAAPDIAAMSEIFEPAPAFRAGEASLARTPAHQAAHRAVSGGSICTAHHSDPHLRDSALEPRDDADGRARLPADGRFTRRQSEVAHRQRRDAGDVRPMSGADTYARRRAMAPRSLPVDREPRDMGPHRHSIAPPAESGRRPAARPAPRPGVEVKPLYAHTAAGRDNAYRRGHDGTPSAPNGRKDSRDHRGRGGHMWERGRDEREREHDCERERAPATSPYAAAASRALVETDSYSYLREPAATGCSELVRPPPPLRTSPVPPQAHSRTCVHPDQVRNGDRSASFKQGRFRDPSMPMPDEYEGTGRSPGWRHARRRV